MQIKVIPESPALHVRIRQVICSAFGQENEALLVERLRRNNRFIKDLSLVAMDNDHVLGHILLFPIDIVNGDKRFPSLSLAPLAIEAEHQNQGIGSILTGKAIERARSHGFPSIIVLGHPWYYPRLGFQPACQFDIRPPFTVPEETFMVREVLENGLKDVHGTVEYPDEYSMTE